MLQALQMQQRSQLPRAAPLDATPIALPLPLPKKPVARSVRFQLKFNAKSISAAAVSRATRLCRKTWRSVGKDIDNWMTVHPKKRRKRKKKKQQKKGDRKHKRNRNSRGNGKETRFEGFTTAANTLRLQWPINLANSAQFNNNLLNKFTCQNIVRVRVSRRDPIKHTHFNINDLSPNKWTRRPPANCMVYYAFGQQVTVGVPCRLHGGGGSTGSFWPAWSVSSVRVVGWEPPHAGFA